jgi:hypothetical protein
MIENNPNAVFATAESEQILRLREAQRERAKNPAMKVQVRMDGEGGSYEIDNVGRPVVNVRNKYAVAHTSNPDPRIVKINGMETSKESYEFLRATNSLPPNCRVEFPFQTTPAVK